MGSDRKGFPFVVKEERSRSFRCVDVPSWTTARRAVERRMIGMYRDLMMPNYQRFSCADIQPCTLYHRKQGGSLWLHYGYLGAVAFETNPTEIHTYINVIPSSGQQG